MKLDLENVSEYGSCSIEPAEGRKITAVFIDFETKLLIVEEQPTCVTTIDAAAARIIPPGERKSRIDYSEQSETDEASGLGRVFRRELDAETDNETISEQLYRSNTRMSRSSSIAFSKTKLDTILDSYLKRTSEQERQESLWKTEYATKTLEERDAGFTPEWYELAKTRDPEFSEILTFMFERDKRELAHQDASPAEIVRRIGRIEK